MRLGANADALTASTCSRRVYCPWRPGMDSRALEHTVRPSTSTFSAVALTATALAPVLTATADVSSVATLTFATSPIALHS